MGLQTEIAKELCKVDGYDWEHIDSWIARKTSTLSHYKYEKLAKVALAKMREVVEGAELTDEAIVGEVNLLVKQKLQNYTRAAVTNGGQAQLKAIRKAMGG